MQLDVVNDLAKAKRCSTKKKATVLSCLNFRPQLVGWSVHHAVNSSFLHWKSLSEATALIARKAAQLGAQWQSIRKHWYWHREQIPQGNHGRMHFDIILSYLTTWNSLGMVKKGGERKKRPVMGHLLVKLSCAIFSVNCLLAFARSITLLHVVD